MAKQQHNTKLMANGRQGALEQQVVIDDNLLPSAEELTKLKNIDPTIINWIMQRAEKEQDTRLDFNKGRLRLAHREVGITISSLWLAFALAIFILGLSALFIYLDREITGTIFGSVGVFVCIQSFLKFGRKEKQSH